MRAPATSRATVTTTPTQDTIASNARRRMTAPLVGPGFRLPVLLEHRPAGGSGHVPSDPAPPGLTARSRQAPKGAEWPGGAGTFGPGAVLVPGRTLPPTLLREDRYGQARRHGWQRG